MFRNLILLFMLGCSSVPNNPADLTVVDVTAHRIGLDEATSRGPRSVPQDLDAIVFEGDDPCDPGEGIVARRATGLQR